MIESSSLISTFPDWDLFSKKTLRNQGFSILKTFWACPPHTGVIALHNQRISISWIWEGYGIEQKWVPKPNWRKILWSSSNTETDVGAVYSCLYWTYNRMIFKNLFRFLFRSESDLIYDFLLSWYTRIQNTCESWFNYIILRQLYVLEPAHFIIIYMYVENFYIKEMPLSFWQSWRCWVMIFAFLRAVSLLRTRSQIPDPSEGNLNLLLLCEFPTLDRIVTFKCVHPLTKIIWRGTKAKVLSSNGGSVYSLTLNLL